MVVFTIVAFTEGETLVFLFGKNPGNKARGFSFAILFLIMKTYSQTLKEIKEIILKGDNPFKKYTEYVLEDYDTPQWDKIVELAATLK